MFAFVPTVLSVRAPARAPAAASQRYSSFTAANSVGTRVQTNLKVSLRTPIRASASDASAPPSPQQPQQPSTPVPAKKKTPTIVVAGYIFLWYAFNIVYNISNKKALTWFPVPWFVSWFQLLIGALWILPLWGLKIRQPPKLNSDAVNTLLPVSIAHIVGHVSTVVSLGAVAVSFTHVVKSMEPFVNVMGSAIFLKSIFPLPVYLSLVPVVAGVIMASVSEVSFTWLGFLSAMTSNFAFTARNIFSKLSMNKPKGENMGAANLFGVLSVMSTIILAPVALIVDHPGKIMSAWKTATCGATAVVSAPKLLGMLVISGLFFYLYQEVAFKALDSVHPITHAVANTVKRVVIIVTSVFVFNNPVTRANALGSSIALFGVLLYSITKNYFPEKKNDASKI